jgi:hypothetical protein
MLGDLIKVIQLEFDALKEIVETLDKLVIFGLLDLNVAVLSTIKSLAERFYTHISSGENSIIISAETEQEIALLQTIEQISLKILA